MKLYLKYLIMQLKSDLEYRKSFVISVVSKTASSIFAFIIILFPEKLLQVTKVNSLLLVSKV